MPGSWREDRLPLSTSNTAGLTLSCQRALGGERVDSMRGTSCPFLAASNPTDLDFICPGCWCVDGEGGEMTVSLLLRLPTSCRGHSYPLRPLGRAETPRLETGFKVPLPTATHAAPCRWLPGLCPLSARSLPARCQRPCAHHLVRPAPTLAASNGFFPLCPQA